ncbi:MAG: hypothetical protein MK202_06920 [Tenacibaculum sp.]|nr:hypothetical protein [Tenacibaculum sp.]
MNSDKLTYFTIVVLALFMIRSIIISKLINEEKRELAEGLSRIIVYALVIIAMILIYFTNLFS